jgi:ketosteroid isomerase-like protein
VSNQNVEVVQRLYDAFNSGDMASILELIDADFEAVVPPAFSAEPDTYRGHAGIRRYFESFREAMSEIRFEPQQFWDVGHSVVVAARLTAQGRRTAIPVEQQFAQLWRIRDGRATAVRTYVSVAEALAAAGRSQERSQ